MRELVVLAAVYGSLPVIPFRPFVGLCMYSWLSYMRPQDLAYGMGGHQLSQLVMLATLFGIALHVLFPKSLGLEKPTRLHPTTLLLVGLGAWTALTAQTAVIPALSRAGGFDYFNFEKTLLFTLLTLGLVSSFSRLRILLVVIALSLGFLGLKYGVWGILSGGTQIFYGPGGFMIGRNSFAVALNMAIPLLVAIGLSEKNKVLRYAAYALVPFTALAVIFTFSRGGFLTLGMVGFVLVLRSGRPVLAAMALVLTLAAFFVFSTESFQSQYFGRVSTVANFEEDESAMGRIAEWKKALRIAADYPVFGIGPNNISAVYKNYDQGGAGPSKGDSGEAYLVSHNSFLQLLVDSGLPALALLLALILGSLWRLQQLQSPGIPNALQVWAQALQVSIAAWIVGGMFLNMAYFDLLYHLFAITACLELIARSVKSKSPVLSIVTSEQPPWWKRQPAA